MPRIIAKLRKTERANGAESTARVKSNGRMPSHSYRSCVTSFFRCRIASDMALSPGIRLGRYEILDAIGAGGMGKV
jgi:hypothetical protein